MNRRSGTFMTIATLVLMALGSAVIAADSNIGIWKMNPAKSKYSPGPAPKSQTVTIEAWGADGFKYVADGVNAEGKPMHWAFQVKYDGKSMPFTGNPDVDTISSKRIDANTVESTTQLKGKPAMTSKVAISADGRTRTLTQTGKNAKGQDVNNVVVYDKQ